jgi:hypothetical protein
MPDISAYLNVYNTSLVVIRSKGFDLKFDAQKETWYATKGEWEFMADDPMQLLGLVAIYDYHNPKLKREYWWKIDEPDILTQLDPRCI